jgi:hypothetical protein
MSIYRDEEAAQLLLSLLLLLSVVADSIVSSHRTRTRADLSKAGSLESLACLATVKQVPTILSRRHSHSRPLTGAVRRVPGLSITFGIT